MKTYKVRDRFALEDARKEERYSGTNNDKQHSINDIELRLRSHDS